MAKISPFFAKLRSNFVKKRSDLLNKDLQKLRLKIQKLRFPAFHKLPLAKKVDKKKTSLLKCGIVAQSKARQTVG